MILIENPLSFQLRIVVRIQWDNPLKNAVHKVWYLLSTQLRSLWITFRKHTASASSALQSGPAQKACLRLLKSLKSSSFIDFLAGNTGHDNPLGVCSVLIRTDSKNFFFYLSVILTSKNWMFLLSYLWCLILKSYLNENACSSL